MTKQDWEAAVGSYYSTRNGMVALITGATEHHMMAQIFTSDAMKLPVKERIPFSASETYMPDADKSGSGAECVYDHNGTFQGKDPGFNLTELYSGGGKATH